MVFWQRAQRHKSRAALRLVKKAAARHAERELVELVPELTASQALARQALLRHLQRWAKEWDLGCVNSQGGGIHAT